MFHPRAFLSRKRNVRLGLVARTKILRVLEKGESDVRSISRSSGLSYNVVIHHLRLLEPERVVARKGKKRPHLWLVTGVGQQSLLETTKK